MKTGWISIHRNVTDHWIWEDKPFSRGQAWIDLLLLANYADNKFVLGNEIVEVEAGTVVTSELKLMGRWGWSKCKVRDFLKLLEKCGMIVKKSDRKKTTIIIENWAKYQNIQTTDKPQKDYVETAARPQKDTINNNDKSNKGNNNKYDSYFEVLWQEYPRKKEKARANRCYQARLKDGFSEKELLQAVKNYAAECGKNRTDEKFIKLPATFLGANTPFLDYLKRKGEEDHDHKTGGPAADFYRRYKV